MTGHTQRQTQTQRQRGKTKQSRAACVHAYLEKAVSTDEEGGAGTGEISDAATGSSAAAAMASIVGSSLRKQKNPNCSKIDYKTRVVKVVECALIMGLI
jgi:hypothetical protein